MAAFHVLLHHVWRNMPFTILGMLMIPKTCAYVWTVLIGFNAMKKE